MRTLYLSSSSGSYYVMVDCCLFISQVRVISVHIATTTTAANGLLVT
jgi:hypothetical protein